jgi:hypothetical protein
MPIVTSSLLSQALHKFIVISQFTNNVTGNEYDQQESHEQFTNSFAAEQAE